MEILFFRKHTQSHIAIRSEERVWERNQPHDHISTPSLELLVSLAVMHCTHCYDSTEQERVAAWEPSLDIHFDHVLQQQCSLSMTLGTGVRVILCKPASVAGVAQRLHAHAASSGEERRILPQPRSIARTTWLECDKKERERLA